MGTGICSARDNSSWQSMGNDLEDCQMEYGHMGSRRIYTGARRRMDSDTQDNINLDRSTITAPTLTGVREKDHGSTYRQPLLGSA